MNNVKLDTGGQPINAKALMTFKEFRDYLGIGETKARELIKEPRNGFAIKIGVKWFVHKEKLDAWLLKECEKY